uniref:Uncharacterized protein n=2 Tax=Anopheles merus TaxID=30066 RepID=A0A182ULS5_ANOME
MFPKKLKQSGLLYKKAAKLEEQLEKEWALQDDHAGPSNQSPVVQSAEDVAMSDPYEEPMASMEEEYLNENGDDDHRISDEGSIHNEDTDGEEYLEEEYLEGEFLEGEFLEEASLEIDPESAKLRDSLRTWLIRNKVARSGSNSLLAILRKASSLSAFSSLPQDVRTLLKAPVNVSQQITKVPGGGEMWYQGVECCFQHYFR